MSDGDEVPCNVHHSMFTYNTYACSDNPTPPPSCYADAFRDLPLGNAFANPTFTLSTDLYVGGVIGPWHAYLCADLVNTTTGQQLELCDEPWSSTGFYEPTIPTGLTCISASAATLWQGSGGSSSYMTTYGPDTGVTGQTLTPRWTMTRLQFANVIEAATNQCGYSPQDTNPDHWALVNSESGIEEIGAGGYGTAVAFMVWNESMTTTY